jgi:hypothetical protein
VAIKSRRMRSTEEEENVKKKKSVGRPERNGLRSSEIRPIIKTGS